MFHGHLGLGDRRLPGGLLGREPPTAKACTNLTVKTKDKLAPKSSASVLQSRRNTSLYAHYLLIHAKIHRKQFLRYVNNALVVWGLEIGAFTAKFVPAFLIKLLLA